MRTLEYNEVNLPPDSSSEEEEDDDSVISADRDERRRLDNKRMKKFQRFHDAMSAIRIDEAGSDAEGASFISLENQRKMSNNLGGRHEQQIAEVN